MTRLEKHDLKMASEKAENRQKRIDLLLSLIKEKNEPSQAIAIIKEYRLQALTI